MFQNKKGIKDAFEKVKQDIFALGSETDGLKSEIESIKTAINHLDNFLTKIYKVQQNKASTQKQENSTHPTTSTHTSTDNSRVQPIKYPDLHSSSGNGGVSTDRQTDNQTDTSTDNYPEMSKKPIDQTISEATEALESLDAIKKAIRLKFKSITQQEMLVFSTIYQLEEQGEKDIDYSKIALKLGLSQSSIRDYTQRLINKGIPIGKTRVNNKKIILKISQELKKIASLSTIMKLREI